MDDSGQDTHSVKVAPRVNVSLSNWYQGMMMVLAAIGLLGGIFSAFYTFSSRLADHEARLSAVERQMDIQRKTDGDFQTEMRTAIAHVQDVLSDLRVTLAARADQWSKKP